MFLQLVKEQKVRIAELTKSKQEALSQQKVYVLAYNYNMFVLILSSVPLKTAPPILFFIFLHNC